MRCHPFSWTHVLTKLGFTAMKQPCRARNGYCRTLHFEQFEHRRMLATFTVNSLIDPSVFSDADTDVSLREAIFRAENTPGADIINFSTDPVHNLNGATIKLQYIDQFNAAFSIYTDVTIDATMLPQGITLDAIETEIDPTVPGGQDGLRVFDLGGPETFTLNVTLAGLTMTGGDLRSYGGSLCGPFGLAA